MIKNIFTFILFISSSFIFANDTVAPASIFDKMSHNEILEVTLEADYTEVLANRKSEEQFSGRLKFVDGKGQPQLWNVNLAIRGKFRRMKCVEMPPLKIKFNKEDLSSKGLSSSNDFKLVTQCVENPKQAKELLLKEYLAYKMYNELTDASFRVQLLKINYKDSHAGDSKGHWAFLIEDTAQLRARLNAKKVKKSEEFKLDDLNRQSTRTAAVFQYMIGNYDWDLAGRRNAKLVKVDNEIVPIPYDFDFAGIINAPYARANSALGIYTRYDRVYLGVEEAQADLTSTFNKFKAKHSELISIIKNCKELSLSERKDMIKYIDTFFQSGPNFVMKGDAQATAVFQAK